MKNNDNDDDPLKQARRLYRQRVRLRSQQEQQQQQHLLIPLEGRAYRNFINAIRTSSTQKSYNFFLRKYMQFYNVTNVDDLLVDKHNPIAVEENMINWIVALRRDPHFIVTYGTRHTYLAAILFFYEINDVVLRKKKISRYLGEEATRKRKDRAYTTNEIKKMLDYATDIRSKVVVLLLASTGMRVGALSELKIRHLKKIPEYNLYRITVYENTNEEYYTFCTPECTKTIEEYFAYRKKHGEKVMTPDIPVIRERFDRIDIENSRKPKVMSTRAIGEIIYILLTKSGLNDIAHSTETEMIRKGSERKDVKRTHGFRKFCNTNMINANLKPVVKEMLLGHKTSLGLDANYYRPNENEILQEYVKAIDYLTINDEHRLHRKVVELTEKQSDIEIMRLEQQKKDNQLEQMRKEQLEFQQRYQREREEQRMAQQRQQELLEALWLQQQQQQQKQEQRQQSKEKEVEEDESEDEDKKYNTTTAVPKVVKYILKGKGRNLTQGEDKVQEYEAKSFILMDGNDDHYDIPENVSLSSLSEEEIEPMKRMPWTLIINNKNNNNHATADKEEKEENN
jgi:integrase